MADTKISALPASTTPLAGTEVVPIVQSGTTKNVSVANLTAGRAVSTGALTVVAADATLDNAYSLKGKLAAGTAVGMIRRNSSDEIAIDEDGYGVKIGFGGRYSFAGGGDFTNALGNYVVGTSGKGIDFSATPGTGTSELFADYEEGTWTATDQSGASLVLTSTYCRYTKVGNLVTVSGFISYPVTASASAAIIGGLPFTTSATQQSAINVWNSAALNLYGYIDASTQRIIFRDNTNSGVTNVSLSNKFVCFSAAYTV